MVMFGVCTKLVENDVVVVKLWMISWLNDVVVVAECVVDELMHWVFIFMDWWWKIEMLLKVLVKLVGLLNYDEMLFCFKFCVTLSALLCSYTCKKLLGTSLGIWKIKIWDFGWKGVGTRNFFDRADEWSLKRADPVISGRWSLKRATSEL